ncbi:MAG: flagellar assembly protein H [Candidatus Eremiobacteraeota bacterium]|nr:flagellar assembly protein H [Candidatus Eremiobacteraeota bacterium]MCW5870414.1 flagellar assembly protein H [Candidatus Eremiobacteraeota bacterium]
MDHDRLFKELLSTFFIEFLELFFPSVAALIDRSVAPVFLDKETFGEGRRQADLVVQVRVAGQDTAFLVHLEPQAQPIENFPEKMFGYFVRFWERYGLRIYPIAIFSYGSRTEHEGELEMRFPDLAVLNFRYARLELPRLDWRAFVEQANPVASALMARMRIRKQDRPRVKLQCLRLLASLRLEPSKSALISHFVDSYLQLEADEVRVFEKILETIPEGEQGGIMRITTSWKEEGRVEGLQEGRVEGLRDGVGLALELKFGPKSAPLVERIRSFDLDALQTLQERLRDGATLEELLG